MSKLHSSHTKSNPIQFSTRNEFFFSSLSLSLYKSRDPNCFVPYNHFHSQKQNNLIRRLKIEETLPRAQPALNKEENVSNSKASQFQSVLYNFNVVAEKIVVNYTQPVADDPTKVIICASDPELKMEINRDIILQSYDPEPLRFLRNIVRQGIPVEELINFSWKGNRRGRPRLVNESPSNPTMERKSMKDDKRMKSFCKLVEEVSKKPLPDNLGTYMHQFLSNLRNKNSA